MLVSPINGYTKIDVALVWQLSPIALHELLFLLCNLRPEPGPKAESENRGRQIGSSSLSLEAGSESLLSLLVLRVFTDNTCM